MNGPMKCPRMRKRLWSFGEDGAMALKRAGLPRCRGRSALNRDKLYWKSSLNMAHSEAGIGREPREPVRFLLSMFPKPAKAKLMRVRMISFFIVT